MLDLRSELKDRKKESHKGDYGRVCIIGGSKGMVGSVYLSAMASLRTGSGLVFNIVPEEIESIMAIKSLENIVFAAKTNAGEMDVYSILEILESQKRMDALALGPGMGILKNPSPWLKLFLENVEGPVLIDADGLNNLAENLEILKELDYDIVLTPHMKEFSRLINKDIDYIMENRLELSMRFAKEYGVVLVLKGNRTIITDGREIYFNETGNPGMATAGSGDVLTGIISSLLGQGYDSMLAARLGVYIHGLSGDLLAKEIGESGIIARDIVSYIPYAMKKETLE